MEKGETHKVKWLLLTGPATIDKAKGTSSFETLYEKMYRKEGLNKIMSLTKISEIMDEWFEMNNTISEDEIFEKEKFDSLWTQTQTIIKEIENKESVSREELSLIMELDRFIYKEIVSEEQLEACDIVLEALDVIKFIH